MRWYFSLKTTSPRFSSRSSDGLKRILNRAFECPRPAGALSQLLKHVLGLSTRFGSPSSSPSLRGWSLSHEVSLRFFKKLDVVGVERLQSARALKLEGASFSIINRCIGIPADRVLAKANATNPDLPETNTSAQMRAFLRRFPPR